MNGQKNLILKLLNWSLAYKNFLEVFIYFKKLSRVGYLYLILSAFYRAQSTPIGPVHPYPFLFENENLVMCFASIHRYSLEKGHRKLKFLRPFRKGWTVTAIGFEKCRFQ